MSLLYTPLVDNSHRRFVPEGLSTLLEDGKFNVERARLLNKVRVASPPFPRTNRTSLVPPLVLSGHAASLSQALVRFWKLGSNESYVLPIEAETVPLFSATCGCGGEPSAAPPAAL